MMEWTNQYTKNVYWRSCYSYILCSVIGGLEDAWMKQQRARAPNSKDNYSRTEQFAITGTQGTGKSILGALLGLVLSQAYGWLVEYQYGSEARSVRFGTLESTKRVIVWDEGAGGTLPQVSGCFLVLVTSFKPEKWHYLAQQATWTKGNGNLVFINPTTQDETVAILEGCSTEDTRRGFKYAGGVPRICLGGSKNAKEVIDLACEKFGTLRELPSSVDQLLIHDKPVEGGQKKLYPGLVAHFIPTVPFREDHHLEFASSYVGQKIREEVKIAREAQVRETLKSLLRMKKAHSLAGWIWEPLFSKKTSDKSSVHFIGCALPASDQPVHALLESTSDYLPLEYQDLKDFVQKCKSTEHNKIVIGKATKDNAEACDGIIVKRNPLQVIGVQLCVSESKHAITEKGVEDLQTLHEALPTTQNEQKSPAAELWFVQPEECLEASFGFVSMQALKFKSAKTISGRRLKSSNDPSYWSEKARKVRQYVSIPIWDTSKGSKDQALKADKVAKQLRGTVEQAKQRVQVKVGNESESQPEEPRLRTVRSTIQVAQQLTNRYASLFNTLLDDLVADGIIESTNAVESESLETKVDFKDNVDEEDSH